VELVESFELATESTGNISLRDPSGWPELDEPTIVWMLNEGPWFCE
jgi:hypothetical protein